MRIGRALAGNHAILVMQLGDRWINLTGALRDYQLHVEKREQAAPETVADLIRAGLFNRAFYRRITEFAQRNGRLSDYQLEGPPTFLLPWTPGKIVAIGRNFRAHVAEFDNQMPGEPILFAKAPSACIGPEEAIQLPDGIGRVDHEGELGVVIKQTARHVSPEDARDYIAGYTLVNDVTARDMQRTAMKEGNPWFCAKSVDTFCPLGPVVVPAEAFDWPVVAGIEVRVNSEVRQHSDTGHYIFDIPQLIAHITRYITLEPGDLIATGTPEGVSPLHPGDVVEVVNEEIGVLRNTVTASAP